jgi:hypothetical protein
MKAGELSQEANAGLGAQTEQAVQRVVDNPWVARLARLGYGVQGLLYGAVGLLAIEVALGVRRAPEDVTGVIALIGRQPYGDVLLVVIAIGLAALALWGFARIVYDPFSHEATVPRNMLRAGFLFSGLTYTALVFTTLRVLVGLRLLAPTGELAPSPQRAAGDLLTTPWGPWLVGLAGLVVMILGGVELVRAGRYDFQKELKRYALSDRQALWATRLGRWGTAARGLVVALVGLFLIQAAIFVEPQEVRGLDGALLALARRPFGPWLLGSVALGLMAFGAYSLLGAWWFRLRQAEGQPAPANP